MTMKEILLYWGCDADLIRVPEFVEKDLVKYQLEFDKWISNINNSHKYWTKDGEGDIAIEFNGDAFIEWINKHIIKDKSQKAVFIKKEYIPSKEDLKLPRINF